MKPIVGEILIDAPAEVVFDYVADERNEPTYNPRMLSADKVTPGPVAAGTRFAALMRTPRRPMPLIIEYTVVERPRALASVSRMPGMEVSGRLTFEPEGHRTRMRWSWDVRCLGWRRVVGPRASSPSPCGQSSHQGPPGLAVQSSATRCAWCSSAVMGVLVVVVVAVPTTGSQVVVPPMR